MTVNCAGHIISVNAFKHDYGCSKEPWYIIYSSNFPESFKLVSLLVKHEVIFSKVCGLVSR